MYRINNSEYAHQLVSLVLGVEVDALKRDDAFWMITADRLLKTLCPNP